MYQMLFVTRYSSPITYGGGVPTYAQTVRVIRADSGKGIEAVRIFSEGRGVLTDSLGEAPLDLFGPGDSLSFRHIGFQPLVYAWKDMEANGFQVTLEEGSMDLSEVSISFNRWAQKRSEISQHLSRITETQIALQQPQTAADMLGISGEVFIQKSQQGGGSPMLRGFAANRVLLVIDGVRMNNAIFRSGNLHNVISLDPYSINQTEIVFGPGAVVFGSDALGGVMDFHTLEPKFGLTRSFFLQEGKANLRYATANKEKTGHVDVNIANDRWSWLLSASYSDFDELKMGSHGREEYLRREYVDTQGPDDVLVTNENPLIQRFSGYQQVNLLQKLRFKVSDKWELRYASHFSQTSDIPRYDRLIETQNGVPREAEWYYGPQKWQMHRVSAQHRRATPLYHEIQLTGAFQRYEESRNDRAFQSPILRTRTEEVRIASLNIDAKKIVNQEIQLFYGVEMLGNWVGSRGISRDIFLETTSPISTRYPDGSTWHTLAGYLNGQLKYKPLWTFNAGLRYNHIFLSAPFDQRFFSFPFDEITNDLGAFNGSLGAIFHPNSSWQAQMNIASGFRAPNIDDIGKVFDSEPGNVVVPNPQLKPEYAYSIDLGVLHKWGENSSLMLNTFYTWLDNAIVRRDFLFEGRDSLLFDGVLSRVQADVNSDNAQVYGLQLKLQTDLRPWMRITSAFTWMDGQDREGLPLRHVTPSFGSTHLIVKRKSLLIDVYNTYSGEISASQLAPSEQNKPHIYASDEAGQPFSPGWHTLNLKTSYSLNHSLSLHMGCENITDVRYRPYSSGLVAPGRNWVFSLEKKW